MVILLADWLVRQGTRKASCLYTSLSGVSSRPVNGEGAEGLEAGCTNNPVTSFSDTSEKFSSWVFLFLGNTILKLFH